MTRPPRTESEWWKKFQLQAISFKDPQLYLFGKFSEEAPRAGFTVSLNVCFLCLNMLGIVTTLKVYQTSQFIATGIKTVFPLFMIQHKSHNNLGMVHRHADLTETAEMKCYPS